MDAGVFGSIERWQAALDRHQALFADLAPGSRVAFVPREGSGILPGRHLAGVREAHAQRATPMLAWEARSGAMCALAGTFTGFETAAADLLFVADDEAAAGLRASLDAEPLRAMKRLIRRGNLMFYVFKAKHELQQAGYEDFLDSLGLAFLGSCR